jgi:hypothetical protein
MLDGAASDGGPWRQQTSPGSRLPKAVENREPLLSLERAVAACFINRKV